MSEDITDVEAPVAAFDWTANSRRLNLGCGWDKREGYLNVDLHAFHEPDLVADVRNLDMLPAGEYDEIVAQDILEHLTRADGPVALREWARLLRIGGQLVLRLPDLIGLIDTLRASDDQAHQTNMVQCLFGTQAYNGDYHLNGFTEPLLRHALHDAGFDVESLERRDGWLFDVVARRVENARPVTAAVGEHQAKGPSEARSPVRSLRLPTLASKSLVPGRVDGTSKVPGGRLVHRAIGRLLSRHTGAVAVQFDDFKETLVDELVVIEQRLQRLEASAG